MIKAHTKPKKYVPRNPDKYVGNINDIWIRSSYERKFMMWCDLNPSVQKWGSEIFPINYLYSIDKKNHKYFIDFFVQLLLADGKTQNLAIEIKPYYQTIKPVKGRKNNTSYMEECLTYQKNIDKWTAAKQWAEQNNFVFQILTENELGIRR